MINEDFIDKNYEKFYKHLKKNIKKVVKFKELSDLSANYYIIFNEAFLTKPCGFYENKKLINFTKGVKDKSEIHENVFKFHKFLELDDDFQKKDWFGGGKKKQTKIKPQNKTKGVSNWFGKYKREREKSKDIEKSKDVEKIVIDEDDGFTEEDDENFVDDDIMEDDDIE